MRRDLARHESGRVDHDLPGRGLPRDLDPRWLQYRATGDREIRDQLVEENQGLVWSVFLSREWPIRPALDKDDYIQAGMMALLRAVEHFDPTRGLRFSTYCVLSVRRAMFRALNADTHRDRPSYADIPDPLPLGAPAHGADARTDHEGGATLADTLADADELSDVQGVVGRRDLYERVRRAVAALPPKELEYAELLASGGTYSGLAERKGVTREAIRQQAKRVKLALGNDVLREFKEEWGRTVNDEKWEQSTKGSAA